MAEFIFKKDQNPHTDDEMIRMSHRKGDFINYKPDGWSDRPNWLQSKYPEKFVVVKCPEILLAEVKAAKT